MRQDSHSQLLTNLRSPCSAPKGTCYQFLDLKANNSYGRSHLFSQNNGQCNFQIPPDLHTRYRSPSIALGGSTPPISRIIVDLSRATDRLGDDWIVGIAHSNELRHSSPSEYRLPAVANAGVDAPLRGYALKSKLHRRKNRIASAAGWRTMVLARTGRAALGMESPRRIASSTGSVHVT